ncbi:hypothetical protein JYU10_00555, partial [bacterium AH-315-J04]|nr:hypothetical protein [bacterium AH-315-J04]
MKFGKTLAVATASLMLVSGCSLHSHVKGHSHGRSNQATVTVRIVAPPIPVQLTNFDSSSSSSNASLVADQAYNPFATPGMSPFHAVIWGGAYDGQEFTHTPAPLTPGAYTFGVFDQENDASYQ